ncbi:Interferon-induced, double-stranded RNA-activated protein kinase, partial [Folsomia candida]
ENYEVKLHFLVTGYTRVFQNIIFQRKSSWESRTGQDFFNFLQSQKKKWNPVELNLLSKRDLSTLDASISAKIFLLPGSFWNPYQPPFSFNSAEEDAIKTLRQLRNDIKHREGIIVTRAEFDNNCTIVADNLKVLNILEDQIKLILEETMTQTVVDRNKVKSHINQLKETSWKYRTLEILGYGAFGVVIKAEDILVNITSAIKIIPDRPLCPQLDDDIDVLREAKNWASLRHENIVKYENSDYFRLWPRKLKQILDFDGPGGKKLETVEYLSALLNSSEKIITGLYIQTEVCGLTLRNWIVDNGPRDLLTRKGICRGIIDGVNYIHSKEIIHRDLRPENIYFVHETGFSIPIKIGDFGLSNRLALEHTSMTQTKDLGSALYRAPEMCTPHQEKPGKAKYGRAVDVYALGLIISEVYDPQPITSLLSEKFGKIKWLRNAGENITREHPEVGKLIVKLASQDPNDRLDKSVSGCLMPIRANLFATTLDVSPEDSELSDDDDVLTRKLSALRVTGYAYGEPRGLAARGLDYDSSSSYRPTPVTKSGQWQGNSSKENLSSKRVDYEEEDAWKSYHRDRVRSESPGPSHRFSEDPTRPTVHPSDRISLHGVTLTREVESRPRQLQSPRQQIELNYTQRDFDNQYYHGGISSGSDYAPSERSPGSSRDYSGSLDDDDVGYESVDSGGHLSEDNKSLLAFRKLLQQNKQIWTDQNMAKFFNLLERTDKHGPRDFGSANIRSDVNRNLYRICRSQPSLVTKSNLKKVLNNCGFPDLAEKVDNILFG